MAILSAFNAGGYIIPVKVPAVGVFNAGSYFIPVKALPPPVTSKFNAGTYVLPIKVYDPAVTPFEGYSLQKDTITSFGNSYTGAAEVATIKITTTSTLIPQIDNWLKNDAVNDAVNGVKKQGGNVIRVRVFKKKESWVSQLWDQHYKVEITAQMPKIAAGEIGFGQLAWAAIVAGILLIGWITSKVLEDVVDVIWGPENAAGERPSSPLGIPWIGWIALGGGVILVASQASSWKKEWKGA